VKLSIEYDAEKEVASFSEVANSEAVESSNKVLFRSQVPAEEFESLVKILALIENSNLSSTSLAFTRQYVTELNIRSSLRK